MLVSKNSYTLTIFKGCRIYKKTILVNSHTACKNILGTEKQLKYTDVEIIEDEDVFKFTKHFVVCNNCNHQTPAYSHFIEGTQVNKCFSRESAYAWSESSMSLFNIGNKKAFLYKPISEKDHFKCMHCGSEPKFSDKKVFITFKTYRNKLTITYPLTDIGDIMEINWVGQVLSISEFPLSETVTFNFKKGTTYIALQTTSGKIAAIRDISNGVTDLTNFTSPLINILSDNITVKRKLCEYFAEIWGKSLPFKENELDIQKFAQATAFVGYDNKIFYSYLPYDHKTMLFDKSYKNMKKKMHYSENLVSVYSTSSLPNMKSVRKNIFENPKFFFYLEELEKLWKISEEEPNFFCAFLNNRQACSILSFLHDHPLAFLLYEDVFKDGLHIPFRNTLFSHPRHVNEYAVAYSTFSEKKRRAARTELKRTNCRCLRYADNANMYFYSIPDYDTINSIPTQNINGYVFTSLKTVMDYIIAGEQLHNCLGKEEFDTPIVGIMRGSKYVAALQVDSEQKYVVQAYLDGNRSIERNPLIFAAFQKWCRNNSYEFDECDTYPF